MHNQPEPSHLISKPAGEDGSRVLLAQILAYHERTKHRLERYAAGPETLDWDAQPNPFREFSDAPRIRLPLTADGLAASFAALHETVAPQPFTLDSIAALLELSFGLSAWKKCGPDLWAVRCNPSSGNLHPTEAYVVCRQIGGIEDGVYHYISRDHSLELRASFSASQFDAPGLLVGISSITWREAWKYGERAFRYCQLDTGHAIGALRYAAAALGWKLHVNSSNHQQIEQGLGLDRDDDFKGAEREEAELLLEITTEKTGAALPFDFQLMQWHGQANILDAHPMYRWPVIDEVAEASRKISVTASTIKHAENYPQLKQNCETKAATLIRQRRSAQRFDAGFSQDADSFYRMMDALLPRPAAPWDVWQESARVHPVLLVHRVNGLAPGIYALPRGEKMQMQAAMRRDFFWTKPASCPEHLPLFLLAATNLSQAARIMNCHQAIARDCTFMLAMLAEFDAPLKEAPWNYRQLHWEAGLMGQVLYMQAEAAGLRGTGIGCYFDDVFHELLGLQDKTFQSLYHFTVGSPLTDSRIINLPPYS